MFEWPGTTLNWNSHSVPKKITYECKECTLKIYGLPIVRSAYLFPYCWYLFLTNMCSIVLIIGYCSYVSSVINQYFYCISRKVIGQFSIFNHLKSLFTTFSNKVAWFPSLSHGSSHFFEAPGPQAAQKIRFGGGGCGVGGASMFDFHFWNLQFTTTLFFALSSRKKWPILL